MISHAECSPQNIVATSLNEVLTFILIYFQRKPLPSKVIRSNHSNQFNFKYFSGRYTNFLSCTRQKNVLHYNFSWKVQITSGLLSVSGRDHMETVFWFFSPSTQKEELCQPHYRTVYFGVIIDFRLFSMEKN